MNYDAVGKPVQLIDTARNIPAHKRNEEKLQAADDKQRTILNSIPDLMFHIHGNGTILESHGRETDLFVPLEAIIGKNDGPQVERSCAAAMRSLPAVAGQLNDHL